MGLKASTSAGITRIVSIMTTMVRRVLMLTLYIDMDDKYIIADESGNEVKCTKEELSRLAEDIRKSLKRWSSE
jgi:hypothetical protein